MHVWSSVLEQQNTTVLTDVIDNIADSDFLQCRDIFSQSKLKSLSS